MVYGLKDLRTQLRITLTVLLTLCVFLHGTLLAPQLVMGPECNAFEGIASSGFREFSWEKEPTKKAQAALKRVAAKARSMMLTTMFYGLIWLPMAPFKVAKIALTMLMMPLKMVWKTMRREGSVKNNSSTGTRSSPDLGAGTPATGPVEEAAEYEPMDVLKTENCNDCRNAIKEKMKDSGPERLATEEKTAKQPGASGLGVNDCWAGIDTENMRVIDGSLKQELDSAFMVAEVEDDEIDLDGSQGEESGPPDPPFFDSSTGEEPIQPGRPTDVYVPSQEPDSPSVIDQLREALSNGSFDGGTVEVDAAAVQKILGQIRDGEAQVMDLEQRYQELLDEQDILEDVRSVASDESQSQAAIAEALAKVAEVLAETHKKPQFGSNWGY